jgi:hypothetical protein
MKGVDMGKKRIDDLKRAKEISDLLGLDDTSKRIEEMVKTVEKKESISWDQFINFVDYFEKETMCDETSKLTFDMLEKIIVTSLEKDGKMKKSELKDRCLKSPPIDRLLETLDGGLSVIHDEIYKTKSTNTGIILMMKGMVSRFQVIEDFSKGFIGHFGVGFDDELKSASLELLLSIKFAKEEGKNVFSDYRGYRDAIAHGGYKFNPDGTIEFWTKDSRGRKFDLPIINSGDVYELYNRSEKKLRIMEIFSRVLRAWGKYGDVSI